MTAFKEDLQISPEPLALRTIERRDLPSLRAWKNDPAARRRVGDGTRTFSEEDTVAKAATNRSIDFAPNTPSPGNSEAPPWPCAGWRRPDDGHGAIGWQYLPIPPHCRPPPIASRLAAL